jgi:hypothetical protein
MQSPGAPRRIHPAGHEAARNIPRMEPADRPTRLATLLLAGALAAAACKPMKPRPATAPPPQAEAPADTARSGGDADPIDSKYQSSSTLGKARDAALRARDRMDAYQQDVAKQADEVFKKP